MNWIPVDFSLREEIFRFYEALAQEGSPDLLIGNENCRYITDGSGKNSYFIEPLNILMWR